MSIKKLMETHKKPTKLLGDIQRNLLARESFTEGRDSQVIHPSEICKEDACARAIYYRLSGWKIPKDAHPFSLEVIFAQGHGYHDKWQNWTWDIGKLRGVFACLSCGLIFTATSPERCPDDVGCGAKRRALVYREVPIAIPDLRIGGKSDGDIDLDPTDGPPNLGDPLLEIKSVGTGTVRFEAASLIGRHTKKVLIDEVEKSWTDWDALWRDIRRPFATHLRQGAIYGAAMDRPEMLFIYEFKPTGAVKEFAVRHDFAMVDDAFGLAERVLTALEKGRRPACPSDGCKDCRAYEELHDAQGATQERPEAGEDDDPAAGEEQGEDARVRTPDAPRGGVPRASGRGRFQHLERRGGDSPDGGVRPVGGVRRDGDGDGGDDRGSGREDLPARPRRDDDQPAVGDRDGSQGHRRVVRRRDRG
jgi:hypothetical protein